MQRLFVTILTLSILCNCKAQDSTLNISPDFTNHPAYIVNNNQIENLPLEQVSILRMEGLSKIKEYIVCDSIHSLFRIKADQEIKILLKPGRVTDDENPIAGYRLFHFDINETKKNRSYLFSISSKSYYNPNLGLPIEVRKANGDNLSLVFRNLKPGEYALQIGGTIYSFGVD